jgi:hypothetical protein
MFIPIYMAVELSHSIQAGLNVEPAKMLEIQTSTPHCNNHFYASVDAHNFFLRHKGQPANITRRRASALIKFEVPSTSYRFASLPARLRIRRYPTIATQVGKRKHCYDQLKTIRTSSESSLFVFSSVYVRTFWGQVGKRTQVKGCLLQRAKRYFY